MHIHRRAARDFLTMCASQTEGLEGALDKTVDKLRKPDVISRYAGDNGLDPVLRIRVNIKEELPGWTPPTAEDVAEKESEGCCVVS